MTSHIPSAAPPSPPAPLWLEWSVTLFSTWLVVGVYFDGWAHIRELPESFFSPWHAIIYSGFGLVAIALACAAAIGRRRKQAWRHALPAGYGLSFIGVGVFMLAGAGDFLWHAAFGIEADIEALYSPPHLLLATGGALIATGPLRSAWKATRVTRSGLWRAVLAATLLLSMFTFFTAESHPFVHPWAWSKFEPRALGPAALALPPMPAGGVGPRELAQTIGVSSFLIQSSILMGLALLLIRRWGRGMPFGWITFMIALNAVGVSIFHSTPWTIPVAVVGGLLGDCLYRWLMPTAPSLGRLRIWSASVPAILYAIYFVALFVQGGVWWAPHLWVGAIAIAGLAGWLVSYLVVPPAVPADRSPAPLGEEARA